MILILKYILVLMLLLTVVYTDVTNDKIENKTLLMFLLIQVVFYITNSSYTELLTGLKMALTVTLILFALYLIKGLGAGDIKLLAVLSFYFPDEAISIVGGSFIVAGMWALLRMAVRSVKREKILVFKEKIHFSIPIAIAVVLVALKGQF